ncbi:oligosaccharide flippase family protein [Lujinxingia vulgaris]|uniref:Oligosaccharide flippase family protein n=1 Tax=Lujinxingia vulgaris TaxID=2600176 RepID=A0A5C6XIK7_9DELT|nr:oligosaccharide flippase family protein [Lujinxingia vulgaris]
MSVSAVDKLKTLVRSAFFKNVALLASGTLVAQLITVASTPVLSRLFLPAAFGVLGMLNSVVNILAGVSALRYDMAIVLPAEDDDAANLLSLSLAILTTLTLITLIVITLGRVPLAERLGQPDAADWLWWVPPLVFVTGVFQILSYWCSRRKEFKRLSISQVAASATSAGSKIGAGVAALGPLGLVAGQAAGQIIASLVLLAQVLREDFSRLRGAFSAERIRKVARTYRDFPRYNAPVTLINGLTNGLPVLLFGLIFDAATAGLYSVAYLILKMPVTLVSNSVRQVYYQRASERLNQGLPLYPDHKRTTLILLGAGILPAIAAALLSPPLFGLVLGEEWVGAGGFARYLMGFLFAMLVAVPASALVPVLNRQRWFLGWQIIALILSTAGIGLGYLFDSPTAGVIGYSVAKALMFIILTLAMTALVRRVDDEGHRVYLSADPD